MKKFLVDGWFRLYNCIKTLGLENGFRYWKIQNQIIEDPEYSLVWAENCESKADKVKNEDPEFAKVLRSWSEELRKQYQEWEKRNNIY